MGGSVNGHCARVWGARIGREAQGLGWFGLVRFGSVYRGGGRWGSMILARGPFAGAGIGEGSAGRGHGSAGWFGCIGGGGC